MFTKSWSWGVVIVAVLVGLLFLFWPKDKMASLLAIPRFIEAVLPVLAIGALLKYLFCCSSSHNE